MQAVREAIPSIDQDLNSQLFQRTSDGTAASVSRGSVSRAGSTSSYGRDENRAPNRAEHANGAKGAVTPQTSSASSGSNGIAQMVLTDAERLKVTRERMERLLQSINDNPRHCAPALVQLRSAVRAVPDEVWLVRVSLRSAMYCWGGAACPPAGRWSLTAVPMHECAANACSGVQQQCAPTSAGEMVDRTVHVGREYSPIVEELQACGGV